MDIIAHTQGLQRNVCRIVILVIVIILFIRLEGANVLDCRIGTYQYEDRCEKCPLTCKKCLSPHMCTECNTGFWGQECSRNCSDSCDNRICSQGTGLCVSCIRGFYFSSNESCVKCSTNCIHCASGEQCTECKKGFTGRLCQYQCTNCKPESGCNIDSGICTDGCQDGLAGKECRSECSPSCKACERLNASKCLSCADEKYGHNCETSCSVNCKENICNDSIGFCTHGCHEGFWSDKCEYKCSQYCKGNTCLRENGFCPDGCQPYFTGSNCLCPRDCECDSNGTCTKCSENSGFLCQGGCSFNCISHLCFRNDTSKCLHGCLGNQCNSTKEQERNFRVTIILLLSFGLIGPGAVMLYVLYRKRCKQGRTSGKQSVVLMEKEQQRKPLTGVDNSQEQVTVRRGRLGTCTSLPCLHEDTFFEEQCNATLRDEFQHGRTSSKTENGDVHKQLILESGSLYSAYAYFVTVRQYKNMLRNKTYIYCKTPVEEKEISAFWNMVWQEETDVIVTFSGDAKTPISKYFWPDKLKNRTYGTVTVQCNGDTCCDILYHRTFDIKKEESETRIVTQLQTVDWPEGSFQKMIGLLKLRQKVKEVKGEKQGALLVHCSDGLSRSGLYIAMDIVIQLLESEKTDDVKSYLCELRDEKLHLIQTDDQCAFLERTVEIWKLISRETVETKQTRTKRIAYSKIRERLSQSIQHLELEPATHLHSEMPKHQTEEPEKYKFIQYLELEPTAHLHSESPKHKPTEEVTFYDRLPSGQTLEAGDQTKLEYLEECHSAEAMTEVFREEIVDFVRTKKMADYHKEFKLLLHPLRVTEYPKSKQLHQVTCDPDKYLSAYFIHDFIKKKAFIICRDPSKRSCDVIASFWHMVYREKCDTIVMLTKTFQSLHAVDKMYLPDVNDFGKYDDITMKTHREINSGTYICRVMTLSKESEVRGINHFQFYDFPQDGLKDDATSLVEFLLDVANYNHDTNRPLVVHCSDGATLSGLFIALDMVIKELKLHSRVNIFKCVQHLKEQRHAIIPDVGQYIYLHKALTYWDETYGRQHRRSAKFRTMYRREGGGFGE